MPSSCWNRHVITLSITNDPILPLKAMRTVAGRGEGHISAVSAVAFSQRSASFIVSGGADKLLKVWDLAAALGPLAAAPAAVKPAKKRKKGKAAEQEAAAVAVEPAAGAQDAGPSFTCMVCRSGGEYACSLSLRRHCRELTSLGHVLLELLGSST